MSYPWEYKRHKGKRRSPCNKLPHNGKQKTQINLIKALDVG